jgi:hypothetical protein
MVHKPEEVLADFVSGNADAIFVASPMLERAVAEEDGVVLVSPPAGEVPKLAKRVVLALTVTRAFATAQPQAVASMTRAIARAELLVRTSPQKAAEALALALPQTKRERLVRLAEIYAKAVPRTPAIEPERLIQELSLLYPGQVAPSLAGIDLKTYVVAPAAPAASGLGRRAGLWFGAALVTLFALLVAWLESRQSEQSRQSRQAQGAPG